MYAGTDPVTGRDHYLTEVAPPGTDAEKEAERARTRLLSQVDEQRNPRTKAMVGELLDATSSSSMSTERPGRGTGGSRRTTSSR